MAQKLVDDAVVRFHKILDSQLYANLEWAESLSAKMRETGLVSGARLISPFLRPHFVSQKQYEALAKSTASLIEAIDRVTALAIAQPALLQRLELLPAERMLASLPTGYAQPHVSTLFSAHANSALHFSSFEPATSADLAQSEMLADLFYEAAPVKDFRKKYTLTKLNGGKGLVSAILKAWKSYGGKKSPRLAIMDFRQAFQTADPAEAQLQVAFFRKHGLEAFIANPEHLEYRANTLYAGTEPLELILRTGTLQEFLLRFDLNHPLIRAYRDGRICLVNSFRAELTQKRTLFSLLTDPAVTGKFPIAERKAIAALIPWTRTVANAKTDRKGEQIDILEYASANRETLVLLPNDPISNLPSYEGITTDQPAWDRALKQALRERYIVQDRIAPVTSTFPVLFYGSLEMRELQVTLNPYLFLGEQKSLTTQLTATQGGFSTMQGLATTFLIK
jgi:hypothetical protein